jgi:hypothetical protein
MTSCRLVTPRLKAGAAAALALFTGLAQAQSPSEVELARRIDRLAAELASVRSQLAQLRTLAAAAAPAGTPATPAPAAAPTPAPVAAATPPAEPATVITSYGELSYSRPSGAPERAQADMNRFVLGYQHRFDARTRAVTELEVEHAVSSADDPGEVEVEQAYVERTLTPAWAGRVGLFLMPVGLLNENHEPTAYYGVLRNFVETAIIPTTWREGGLQAIGQFDNGLTLQGGLTTGFDLGKWDAASAEGSESPLGSIHQELALAKANRLSVFGAANWRGIPGLLLGGSVFTGGATQEPAVASSRITLWDLHARWTPGRWDLSALVTAGRISDTAALNQRLVGNPTLIPAAFDGAYLQAAYRLWSRGGYALAPFARVEWFNTGRRYAEVGTGLTPPARPTERVTTLGANFQLTPEVVLKADLQRFRVDSGLNRVDLGLGWSF